jgi:hypothetical protein
LAVSRSVVSKGSSETAANPETNNTFMAAKIYTNKDASLTPL